MRNSQESSQRSNPNPHVNLEGDVDEGDVFSSKQPKTNTQDSDVDDDDALWSSKDELPTRLSDEFHLDNDDSDEQNQVEEEEEEEEEHVGNRTRKTKNQVVEDEEKEDVNNKIINTCISVDEVRKSKRRKIREYEFPNRFQKEILKVNRDPSSIHYIEAEILADWINVVHGPIISLQRDLGWKFTNDDRIGFNMHLPKDQFAFHMQSDVENYLSSNASLKIMIGPPGEPTTHDLPRYGSVDVDSVYPNLQAYILNSGGSVWGADWCPLPDNSRKQYFVLSSMESPHARRRLGVRDYRTESSIQLWSVENETHECKLELVIVHTYGCALQLSFCPLPFDAEQKPDHTRILGLLAGCFGDGNIYFMHIPHPDDLQTEERKQGEPLFVSYQTSPPSFHILGNLCVCMAWRNSRQLGIGFKNGFLAVIDVIDCIAGYMSPMHYFAAHIAPINEIAWIGRNTESQLLSTGYDGHINVIDLRDTRNVCSLIHMRYPRSTIDWMPYMHAFIYTESGSKIDLVQHFCAPRKAALHHLDGFAWDIATSNLHPFVAIASADGTCIILNARRTYFCERHPSYRMFRNVYRLLHHKPSDTYRFVDNIQHSKSTKTNETIQPFEIAIQTVKWNPNYSHGGWLLSTTSSGLCRIDNTSYKIL